MVDIEEGASCADCIFGRKLDRQRDESGAVDLSKPAAVQCRRYPPTWTGGFTQSGHPAPAQWPVVAADCYCGELTTETKMVMQ